MSLGIADDAWVVGAVGSLIPVKGFDVLLEAAARLAVQCPKLRLLVVGDGPLRGELAERAARLGLTDRVRFAGRREDVAAMLAAMDAYACSSRSEGMSNALLEAMASGLPVVATHVGDNPILIRDAAEGLLVPADDADWLYAALRRLHDCRDLSDRLGAAAHRRAGAFGFQRTVAAYERFYRELMRVPGAAPHRLHAPAYA